MDENFTTNQDSELFLNSIEEILPKAKEAHQHIICTINTALKRLDIELLLSMIPYIEEDNGMLSLQYIAQTTRIWRILHIIQLENQFHLSLFSTNCSNSDDLIEKYMLSLFALRRILFDLSISSRIGARKFLQEQALSPFAIHLILTQDLIHPNRDLFQSIIKIHYNIWDDSQKTIFISLMQSNGGTAY